MSKPNSRTNQKMTNDKFWQFRNLAGDDQKAELLLYGDISERSWWEDAATPKRFADDLAALGDVKKSPCTSTPVAVMCLQHRPLAICWNATRPP